MSGSEPLAATVAPLFVRVALAVTFIWAGAIKVFWTMPVQGPQAAALTQMGLTLPTARPTPVPAAAASPAVPAPATPLPVPESETGAKPAPKKTGALPDAARPATVALGAAAQTTSAAGTPAAGEVGTVEVRRLYAVALMLQSAANPPARDGKAVLPLWPARLATGNWPLAFAWAAAMTELVGGVMVLIGLFTRVWCFGLACTMLNALWLTQIGPAVQAGTATLGFLPSYPLTDGAAWMPALWQFALLMLACTGLFAGAGSLSVDRSVLGPSAGKKSGG